MCEPPNGSDHQRAKGRRSGRSTSARHGEEAARTDHREPPHVNQANRRASIRHQPSSILCLDLLPSLGPSPKFLVSSQDRLPVPRRTLASAAPVPLHVACRPTPAGEGAACIRPPRSRSVWLLERGHPDPAAPCRTTVASRQAIRPNLERREGVAAG